MVADSRTMVSDDDARRARLWERDAGRQFTGVGSYFFWVMMYLLIMQMKDKMDPERAITRLFSPLLPQSRSPFSNLHSPAYYRLNFLSAAGTIQGIWSRVKPEFEGQSVIQMDL